MNNSLEKQIKWWKNAQFVFEAFGSTTALMLLGVFMAFLTSDIAWYDFKRDSLLSPYFDSQYDPTTSIRTL